MPHPSGYLFAYSKGSQLTERNKRTFLSWKHVPFHKGFKLATEGGFKVSRKGKYLLNVSLRVSRPKHHEHSFITIYGLVNNHVIHSHTFRIPESDTVRLTSSFITKLKKGNRLKFEFQTHCHRNTRWKN